MEAFVFTFTQLVKKRPISEESGRHLTFTHWKSTGKMRKSPLGGIAVPWQPIRMQNDDIILRKRGLMTSQFLGINTRVSLATLRRPLTSEEETSREQSGVKLSTWQALAQATQNILHCLTSQRRGQTRCEYCRCRQLCMQAQVVMHVNTGGNACRRRRNSMMNQMATFCLGERVHPLRLGETDQAQATRHK